MRLMRVCIVMLGDDVMTTRLRGIERLEPTNIYRAANDEHNQLYTSIPPPAKAMPHF